MGASNGAIRRTGESHHKFGNAKVSEENLWKVWSSPAAQQDIGGLYVLVNNLELMHLLEGICELVDHVRCCFQRNGGSREMSLEPVIQRPFFTVRHHQISASPALYCLFSRSDEG